MKSKNFIAVLFALIISCNLAMSQWFWVNPKPQGNNLQDVCNIQNSVSVAVGDFGTIIRSSDNGLSWTQFNMSTAVSLESVSFFDNSTGIAVGGYNQAGATGEAALILKSTDAGISWQNIALPYDSALFKIQCVNNDTAYILIRTGIFRTFDKGVTWSRILIDTRNFKSMYFANASTGFTLSDTVIYRTTNTGLNWSLRSIISTSPANLNSITFVDANTGFIIGGSCYKTTNGGLNWSLINLSGYYYAGSFKDNNRGFFTGNCYPSAASVARTTDGGSNWVFRESESPLALLGIFEQDFNNVVCVGFGGGIVRTSNAGENWMIQSPGTRSQITQLQFADQYTGYAVSYFGALIKSTNRGLDWYDIGDSAVVHSGLRCLCFVNGVTGFVAGGGDYNQGKIFRTTNGGANWSQFTEFIYQPVYRISFGDAFTGYAACSDGSIYKTTNSGINWFSRGSVFAGITADMKFLNALTGYAVNSNSIARTTDGGIIWEATQVGVSAYRPVITFPNTVTGYASFSAGRIYKTTNSGTNWIQLSGPVRGLPGISFPSAETGFLLGYPYIYRSTNGGASWDSSWLPSYSRGGLLFISNDTGFVYGDNGVILKTTSGGLIIGIENQINNIPIQFSLSQNYPNPFNPSTTIKFEIPPSKGDRGITSVKLVIYDVLGREVATLINQQMQPGSYSVDWDASNYPSGVYFYKLEAGSFVQSKKMVLLK